MMDSRDPRSLVSTLCQRISGKTVSSSGQVPKVIALYSEFRYNGQALNRPLEHYQSLGEINMAKKKRKPDKSITFLILNSSTLYHLHHSRSAAGVSFFVIEAMEGISYRDWKKLSHVIERKFSAEAKRAEEEIKIASADEIVDSYKRLF